MSDDDECEETEMNDRGDDGTKSEISGTQVMSVQVGNSL